MRRHRGEDWCDPTNDGETQEDRLPAEGAGGVDSHKFGDKDDVDVLCREPRAGADDSRHCNVQSLAAGRDENRSLALCDELEDDVGDNVGAAVGCHLRIGVGEMGNVVHRLNGRQA